MLNETLLPELIDSTGGQNEDFAKFIDDVKKALCELNKDKLWRLTTRSVEETELHKLLDRTIWPELKHLDSVDTDSRGFAVVLSIDSLRDEFHTMMGGLDVQIMYVEQKQDEVTDTLSVRMHKKKTTLYFMYLDRFCLQPVFSPFIEVD